MFCNHCLGPSIVSVLSYVSSGGVAGFLYEPHSELLSLHLIHGSHVHVELAECFLESSVVGIATFIHPAHRVSRHAPRCTTLRLWG